MRGIITHGMKDSIQKIAKLPSALLALFLSGFFAFYFAVALQGIPFEQMEGIPRGWALASKMSWPEFFQYLLRPVSTALTSSGQHLADVRISESMVQKFLYMFWGESMMPLLVMNVLAAALLVILFFNLAFYLTANKLSSLLATVFLFTTPVYLWVVMEYGDYAPTDQVFLLAYFFLFFNLMGLRKKISGVTVLKIILLWLTGMIAVHAKEPNKLLVPAVSWALLFLNPKNNLWKPAAGKLWSVLMAGCVFILSLPLVLVEFKSQKPLVLSWNGPFNQFVFQTNGWEDEKAMCLFTLERVLPVSVLANFGFFLCWPLLILAAWRLVGLFKKQNAVMPERPISAWLFLGVWLSVSVSFYLIQDSDTYFRYLSWALMPFALVAAVFLTRTVSLITPKIRIAVAILLCGLVIFKIADNFQHSLFFRRQLEKIWAPKWSFQEKVYQDSQNLDKVSLFGLYDFWSYDPFAIEQFPYMPPANVTPEKLNSPEFLNNLKKFGKMYFVSYSEITAGPGKITQLAKMDVDRLSTLSAMRANRKKKPASFYYLYRIDLR